MKLMNCSQRTKIVIKVDIRTIVFLRKFGETKRTYRNICLMFDETACEYAMKRSSNVLRREVAKALSASIAKFGKLYKQLAR